MKTTLTVHIEINEDEAKHCLDESEDLECLLEEVIDRLQDQIRMFDINLEPEVSVQPASLHGEVEWDDD